MMKLNARKVAAAVLLLAAASGCGREHESASSARPALRVDALRVTDTEESGRVSGVGTLHALREADLAGRLMGTVIEIRKRAGEPVRRGEILVVLDARDVNGQITQTEGALAQARAAAVLAEANLARFESLFSRGSASQLELDQVRYQRDAATGAVMQAEGALAAARSYRAYAEIAAPFDGHVVDRLLEVGDLAAPGAPLLRIEDASRLRLHVTVAASRAGGILPGSPVRVTIPGLGDRVVEGRIGEIVPAADAGTHTTLVKVDLPEDPSLRAGLYARADFPAGRRRALRVPGSAIVRHGGLTGVFVIVDGHAEYRLVTLADEPGDTPEVVSGLASGEAVIVLPPPGLESGRAVEVGA